MEASHKPTAEHADELSAARRKFLAACGKLAVATPPAITLMLAASERNFATAASGGSVSLKGNNGFGNGGGDGVPGKSGSNKSPNAGEKAADKVR